MMGLIRRRLKWCVDLLDKSKEQTPAGTQHQNDVVSTSMRRDHVTSTFIRRHFNVVCPLGRVRHLLVTLSMLNQNHQTFLIFPGKKKSPDNRN